MVEKLGVALLGLDHWYIALSLAPTVAASERTRLVAVAHDDQARARQVAQEHGAETWTTDYRAALDRPDVDIVVAMYSSDRNVAICREAAGLGKHIVSVKPMAMDLAGADAIAKAVRAAGVHFFPYESSHRLNAADQRSKQWIDEGRIGRPLRYTHTMHSSLPLAWPGSQESGWWVDPARVPGGGWLDHSIYAVDTLRWLFGSEPVQVQGVAGNQRYPDLPLDDYGIAVFTLANGAVAIVEDTWTAERGYGFGHSEIAGSAGAIVDQTGTGGRIALRGDFGFDGWMAVERPRGPQITPVEHVAICVQEQSAPVATVEDGRANLAACLAFYEAARAAISVRLDG
jgi:predicted dehydrogenase